MLSAFYGIGNFVTVFVIEPVVPTHAISSFFFTSQSNLKFSKGITRCV